MKQILSLVLIFVLITGCVSKQREVALLAEIEELTKKLDDCENFIDVNLSKYIL